MGGKDKRQRRSEKKFATLEAQFTKLNAPTKSPAHGPARSPALVPVKLSRVLAPIELLSGDILARIAAFVNKAPKETIKLFSTFSRPLFIAVESARYHHDLSVEACLRDAIDRTLAKRVASSVAPTPNAAAVVAASPPGSPKMSAFDALEGSQDVDLLFRASIALLRHRRSLLYQHYRKGHDWDPIGQEWILKCVASGRLPLATVEAGTGRTLLHIALLLGERLLVNKLIQAAVQSTAGFNPWVQDALKRTVLHVAAAEGLTDSVLAILHQVEPGRMEAYGNLQTLNKRTAAEEATHHRHTKLAAALVEALRAAHYNDDDEEDGDDYDDGCEDDDYYAA